MTTTWKNVPKPFSTTSVVSNAISIGEPIGLLLALTYATATQTSVLTGIWTNISKPAGTSYTNIPKAT